MADITVKLTATATVATDFLAKVTDNWGWTANIEEDGKTIPNPLTRKQFLNKRILSLMQQAYEAECAKGADSVRAGLVADARKVSITVSE
jgi:hypothetical protein